MRTPLRLFRRKQKTDPDTLVSLQLTPEQDRFLRYAIIVTLLIGVWLIKSYLVVVLLGIVSAFLSFPIYKRLYARSGKRGRAVTGTLLITILILIIPLSLIITITVYQIDHLLTQLASSTQHLSINEFGQNILDSINRLLETFTNGAYHITADQLREHVENVLSKFASAALDILSSSVSNLGKAITNLVLYFYIFSAVLIHHQTLLQKVRQLNPLNDRVADLYLARLGAMTKGIVGGQFVIATAQGIVSALGLYIAGIHYFAFMALILTILSIIPLGAGIVTIPIGIIMILLGNIWQGVLVIANHLLIVTNIDNILRPYLIPKEGKLNAALTMLAVFSGIAVFGFVGILIGPLVMIFIITTVDVYLAVESGQLKQTKKSSASRTKPGR